MESPSIEQQRSLSKAKVEPCLQENTTQFNGMNNINNEAFVPYNNKMETNNIPAVPSIIAVTIHNTKDDPESVTKENKFSVKKYSSHIYFIFVMVFVIAIALMPITLFFTISPRQGSILDDVDFQSCSISTDVQEEIISDDTLIQVCKAEGIQILDNDVSAVRALQVVYALGTMFENDQCVEDALPFLCTAVNYLCVDNTSLPSELLKEECIQVRDNKCSSEWRIVENLFNISVPSCDSFKNGTNVTFSSAPIQTCPDMFKVFCGSLCLPSCQDISLFRDGVGTAYRVWFIILYAVNLIGGVITVIASIVYRQKMLKYPLIFIVYATVMSEAYGFFVLLPSILGSNDILCSDDNLIVTTSDSTVFCQIQGFIIQGSAIMVTGFWMAHILHIFYSLMFPFRAHRFMTSHSATRRVHFIEVIVIVTLGLLCSTITVSTSGYTFVGFPKNCVAASLSSYFYAQLLPVTIGSSIGILALCTSVLLVSRRKNANSSRKTLFTKFSAAEAKLFAVFLYYGIAILAVLFDASVSIHMSENIRSTFAEYIICSAGGDKVECNAIMERLYNTTIPVLITLWIAATLVQLSSIVNLNFVLQNSDIKKILGYLLAVFNKIFHSLRTYT